VVGIAHEVRSANLLAGQPKLRLEAVYYVKVVDLFNVFVLKILPVPPRTLVNTTQEEYLIYHHQPLANVKMRPVSAL
jgi:hypothetical protein